VVKKKSFRSDRGRLGIPAAFGYGNGLKKWTAEKQAESL